MPAEWQPTDSPRTSRWQAAWPAGETNRFQRLSEASTLGGFDPDELHSAAQLGSAYVRRLSANADRDLEPLTQDRALALAYYLHESNPLAKRILELTRDYVLGEGVRPQATGDDEGARGEIQAVLDRFWDDPINLMDLHLYEQVLELGLFGEQCWPVSVNPKDGHVRLGYVDPGQIVKVVPEPLNPKAAGRVYVKGRASTADYCFRVVHVDDNPNSPSFGRLVGVETDNAGNVLTTYRELDDEGREIGEEKLYAGACFYFAVNKVTKANRGRSDLLCLADWVDTYDQILFNEADRSLLMKSFVYDVTLTGADEKQVQKRRAEIGAPKPGSVRVHNEKETWAAVSPDLKAEDAQNGADLLLSYIAAGSGHPKTWLSGMMDVNRATAQALDEPAIKRLTARQRLVRYILTRVLTFALDQAELAGVLAKRPKQAGTAGRPEPWPFKVDLPAIKGRDLSAASEVLAKVIPAVVAARADGAIDLATEQRVLVTLVGQLGVEVDLEEMQKAIEAEQAERERKAEEMQARLWQRKPDEEGEGDEGRGAARNGKAEVSA